MRGGRLYLRQRNCGGEELGEGVQMLIVAETQATQRRTIAGQVFVLPHADSVTLS